jgi:hypothetical protein
MMANSRDFSWKTKAVRSIALFAAMLALLFSAAAAKAGCGEPNKAGAGPKLSWLEHQVGDPDQPATIVGLWHLKYTAADGSAFLESFKTWHADGTEFENAFLPPTGGNICYGVWKQVGHLTVRLHHVGLMFGSDGALSATFTVDELDTVAIDGKTYRGTFDFKVYDPSGNLLQEVKGTQAGTRITVS